MDKRLFGAVEILVVAYTALGIALAAITVAIWRTRRTYNDSDVNELADEVSRLARRARADTMRRVRTEAQGASADGPPELKVAAQSASIDHHARKQQLRQHLLGGNQS